MKSSHTAHFVAVFFFAFYGLDSILTGVESWLPASPITSWVVMWSLGEWGAVVILVWALWRTRATSTT